jgi:cytochrome P450
VTRGRLFADRGANGDGAPATMTVADRLGFLARVVAPTWAKGVLLRRRGALALAERWDTDGAAVRFMQNLRRRYGEAPLAVGGPGRPQYLLLSAADVARVLAGAPAPFTPASREKQAALGHFEPHTSLATRGPKRQPRRAFNDAVLESANPNHDLAQSFAAIVRSEASRLLATAAAAELTWPLFTEAWYAAARRIVLGASAGDDRELTEMLGRLRARANWVYVRPVHRALRERYYARLRTHLARAEAGSLAEMIARLPRSGEEAVADQVTQWLFAFDGGGITAFRALALLATHAHCAQKVEPELAAWRAGHTDLPYLRAAFVETARLWPTTPAILREATQTVTLGAACVPKGAGLIIYAPFFHRDTERLANADRFTPEAWLYKDPAQAPPFIPFSAGPAACPGRHVVALIGGAWLAALLEGGPFRLASATKLAPDAPLPGTLDHFSLRFRRARETA